MIRTAAAATLLLTASISSSAVADIELPPHLASHMVVQAGEPVVISGVAEPRTSVAVVMAGRRAVVRSDAAGRFRVSLRAMEAGYTPHTIVIENGDDRVQLDDVLVGEVWLCSGQSNMQWPVSACDRLAEVQADADRPTIRTFNANRIAKPTPQATLPGRWLVCSPETVGSFSGAAYHFGRQLSDRLDVPIGLVHSSWGGSRSEAWTSPGALASSADGRRLVEAWNQIQRAMRAPVPDHSGVDVDDSDWATGPVPGSTTAFGIADGVDGIFWQRIPVTIPAEWAGRDLRLSLGVIDDNDVTFFNGQRVGAANGWQTPRDYTVPGSLVTGGEATIAIRIVDTGGPGGLHGEPSAYFMHPVDDAEDRMELRGPARMSVAAAGRDIPVQHRPAELYNAMIHPLLGVNFAGVIWYQGESNGMGEGCAAEYAELLPLMINDWRRAFDEPELPFYIVQIANLAYRVPDWDFPGVRDVQRRMLELPATGLAVTTDIGDPDDIHPRNKHDVGDRLARWALVDVYGLSGIVKSGPLIESARVAGDGVLMLQFESFGSPLAVSGIVGDRAVGAIEVAGPTGEFHAADAMIAGGSAVRVQVPEGVANATRVRYAWAPDPVEANLVNEAGLPAAAFEVVIDAERGGRGE